jgi:uncharacterized membrane protein
MCSATRLTVETAMAKKNVLLVGYSWATSATRTQGFDQFGSVTFHLGAEPLVTALKGSDFDLTYMPAHEVATAFPFDLDGLVRYDAIILRHRHEYFSPLAGRLGAREVDAEPPEAHPRMDTRAGGLVMIDGYFSFQGIDGKACWRATPVEEALPVSCFPYDDRLEIPEGFSAQIVGAPDHSVLAGLEGPWPLPLGANEVRMKDQPGVEVLAQLPAEEGGHPLLVVGGFGGGRSLAWTSDIGPHWLPASLVDWRGYRRLWINVLGRVTRVT